MANHDEVLRDWPIRVATLPPAPQVPYADSHWDWAAIHAQPQIDPTAWVAPGAVVYGRVVSRQGDPARKAPADLVFRGNGVIVFLTTEK